MFTVGMGGTDHWNSKLSTNFQCEKNNHPAFLKYLKKSAQKSTK